MYRFTPFGPRIVLIDGADGLATVADVACDPVTGDIYVTGAPGSPALYRFDSTGAPVGAQPLRHGRPFQPPRPGPEPLTARPRRVEGRERLHPASVT